MEKEREEEERVQINAETSRIKEEKELNAIVLEHEKLEKQKTVEPAQTKMKVNSNIMNNKMNGREAKYFEAMKEQKKLISVPISSETNFPQDCHRYFQ